MLIMADGPPSSVDVGGVYGEGYGGGYGGGSGGSSSWEESFGAYYGGVDPSTFYAPTFTRTDEGERQQGEEIVRDRYAVARSLVGRPREATLPRNMHQRCSCLSTKRVIKKIDGDRVRRRGCVA